MKKKLLYSIAITLLLIITVSGGTYAFFLSEAVTDSKVSANTSKIQIIYQDQGVENINGPINVVSKKEEGKNTTVNIRVAKGSPSVKADLYLKIEEITTNIAIEGFIWEVYGYKNNQLVYEQTGNFQGKKNNDIITIVKDYQLSEDNTSFVVYFWLDGNQTNNNVLNSSFRGYIGAKSEDITAKFN